MKQIRSLSFSPFRLAPAALPALIQICTLAAAAKDPLEAAQELAGTSQSDPNGYTVMIVSICMLFVFALTLIIAASMHVFKKKPLARQSSSQTKDQEQLV